MTVVLDTVRSALDRAAGSAQVLERVDIGRSGDLILTTGGDRRRWFAAADDSVRELRPESDESLPIASELPELRDRGTVEVLAYRPGRRLVLRMTAHSEPRIIKAYRRRKLADAVRRHATAVLAMEGQWLRVPAIIERDDSLAFFAMRDLGNRRFDLSADPVRFARIGTSLDCFRRFVPDFPLPVHDHGAELRELDRIADRALAAVGSLPEGWDPVRRRLTGQAACLAPVRPGLAHRDLHDGQLITLLRGVGVLDFDMLCRADRVLDVANLSAHLHLRALQGVAGFTGERAAECSRQLVEASAPADESTFASRFRFYHSATFLRLSLVYHMRPPWSHVCARLVERADRSFGEAADGAA